MRAVMQSAARSMSPNNIRRIPAERACPATLVRRAGSEERGRRTPPQPSYRLLVSSDGDPNARCSCLSLLELGAGRDCNATNVHRLRVATGHLRGGESPLHHSTEHHTFYCGLIAGIPRMLHAFPKLLMGCLYILGLLRGLLVSWTTQPLSHSLATRRAPWLHRLLAVLFGAETRRRSSFSTTARRSHGATPTYPT